MSRIQNAIAFFFLFCAFRQLTDPPFSCGYRCNRNRSEGQSQHGDKLPLKVGTRRLFRWGSLERSTLKKIGKSTRDLELHYQAPGPGPSNQQPTAANGPARRVKSWPRCKQKYQTSFPSHASNSKNFIYKLKDDKQGEHAQLPPYLLQKRGRPCVVLIGKDEPQCQRMAERID
jgi:hypothetical protein